MRPVLGIDPGTRKCGLAVVERTDAEPLALRIVPTEHLLELALAIVREFDVRAIALGRGTNAAQALERLRPLAVPVRLIDERETTLRARGRYFRFHPPTGWRRLVPRGMLLPPRPIDDYAAALIAERFLLEEAGVGPPS